MLLDVAVTHSRYSYFESIPTSVVKKTQLWRVQSFLFLLLFIPSSWCWFIIELVCAGSWWTLRTWIFLIIISNKFGLKTQPQLRDTSLPFFFLYISSLSNEVHGQKLWDKSSWCCVLGSCKHDEKGWEHFRIIFTVHTDHCDFWSCIRPRNLCLLLVCCLFGLV